MRLAPDDLDTGAELAAFAAAAPGDEGALASFAGLCRGAAHDGSALSALVLETYRAVTLRSMEAIVEAARARFAITRALVIHRHGRIAPGEAIVLVACAAVHRRAALQAVDFIMDGLKSRAVFWKREETADGARWIEPTEADYADRARWGDDAGF